ncbi:MAG: EAL domain-containing protein [Actinomycetota bacterium]
MTHENTVVDDEGTRRETPARGHPPERSTTESSLPLLPPGGSDAVIIARMAQPGSDAGTRAVVVGVNDPFIAATGLRQDQTTGLDPLSLLRLPELTASAEASLRHAMQHGIDTVVETRWAPNDGGLSWVEIQVHAADWNGLDNHTIITIRDVDGEHRSHDELAHAATHDALTQLSNRTHVLHQLRSMLVDAAAAREHIGVLFVDLDHFKLVNDTFGHHAGDQLIQQFADRLRNGVRAGDLIGRFGGDEFIVACRLRTAGDDASIAAERILASMRQPFEVPGRQIVTSASIGLAISELDDTDPDGLIQAADTALFEAKRLGRGRVQAFTPELRRRVVERVVIESELRTALVEEQLRLHYQPQVDLHSGRVVGVEALVRWQHPERGLLAPADFIAVAEESGLIGPIGHWVLQEACRQMDEWRCASSWAPPLMTVNVSPLELDASSFVDEVRTVLARTGLDPRALCLELTESAVMTPTAALDTLADLRDLGCYIGIDDFGTGYSSLARLRDLPVEVLKIDRSFVDGLGTDPNDSAIVSSIMSLALTMGLHVIAEGVEEPRQAEALTRLGCQFAQGYLFARPMPADALISYGRRRLWRPITGDDAAADGVGGPVVSPRAARRGRRRFIHEFLDQIGVPMSDRLDETS